VSRLAPLLILPALLAAPRPARAGMRMTLVALDAQELAEARKDPSRVDRILESDRPGALDLDKAWHGIHYLLAGTAWTPGKGAGQVILGGTPLGGDQGYGPARFFSVGEVRLLAGLLEAETPAKLTARFDAKAMDREKIYPDVWVREGKEALDYLLEYYVQLVAFYRAAAKADRAVLFVVD